MKNGGRHPRTDYNPTTETLPAMRRFGHQLASRPPDPASPATGGTYRWWVVAMLWLVCLFNYADRQAIFSVFPLLKTEMQLTPVELGVVGGAFMWVYAAALPFAGLIGDRANRKRLVL